MGSDRKTGIRKIAELAGVSTATVSRVLNGNTSVDPELSARVLECAEKYGYQPSPAARYMRSKKSGLIGIVVPKLSLSYFSGIVNGVIDRARDYGQLTVVGTVEGRSSTEKEFLNKISSYMLDGLIYCPVSAGNYEEELELLRQVPLVVAGRRSIIDGVPFVSTNDENAGYTAAKYLLRMGRTEIGYLAGFWEKPHFGSQSEMLEAIESPLSASYSALDRLRGLRRALSEKGLSLDFENVSICGFDAESGYSSARELLGRLRDFDSLIVPNCIVARGVYRFLKEQGIQVPSGISLVSMDDMGTGDLLEIPTTSIVHDMYKVGVESVEQLNRIISGEKPEDRILDVNLEIRQSTTVKKIFN